MMLEEGTVNFTTEEISLKLDELGSSISLIAVTIHQQFLFHL